MTPSQMVHCSGHIRGGRLLDDSYGTMVKIEAASLASRLPETRNVLVICTLSSLDSINSAPHRVLTG